MKRYKWTSKPNEDGRWKRSREDVWSVFIDAQIIWRNELFQRNRRRFITYNYRESWGSPQQELGIKWNTRLIPGPGIYLLTRKTPTHRSKRSQSNPQEIISGGKTKRSSWFRSVAGVLDVWHFLNSRLLRNRTAYRLEKTWTFGRHARISVFYSHWDYRT